MPVKYDELLKEMVRRDENDTSRRISPLRQAHDAIRLDTTGLEFEQSLAKIIKVVEDKLA